jgi:inosine/xanthosine triphosphatase
MKILKKHLHSICPADRYAQPYNHDRMKIIVGTTNAAKVAAVKEIVKEYAHLADATIESVKTESGVSDQPKSLQETIAGAMNRARSIFNNCDYSIGLESGLMEVPNTKSGFMDLCVCAIYDGKEFHLGLSSAWEFPDPKIMDLIVKGGMNMSEAINHVGLTSNADIGTAEGAIGLLTKGRMDRKEYTKQALRTALIHLEQFE